MPVETPVTDEVPVTQWEAERKKEVSLAAETAHGGDPALEGWEKEREEQRAELEMCWGDGVQLPVTGGLPQWDLSGTAQ